MSRKIALTLLTAILLMACGPGMRLIGLHNDPIMSVAHAEDDDDDSGDTTGPQAPGGGVLNEGLQWQMAATAIGKREYDDAAVLCLSYADANPDGPHAIEALWNAYSIYRNNRPDNDKKKQVYDKLLAAGSKWITKYGTSDKERAGSAEFYLANLYDNEGQHDSAVSAYEQLIKRFAGTNYEQNAWWTLAEWSHNNKDWTDAIQHYEGYRKCVGITEYGALSVFREADCYEQLKDNTDAVATYQIVFDPKYNWGWWQLGYGALDAARRLVADGAPDISRKMAMMIVDHCPQDGGWTDVQNQAHTLLGEAPSLKVYMYPYMYNTFSTSNMNIDGGTKLTVTHEPRLLVRVSYATKAAPFNGNLTITPKVNMVTIPDGFTKTDGDKPSYTIPIVSPDKNGNSIGDQWYNWKQADEQTNAPANLEVTRTWEKAGADWGNCTIRVQSSSAWDVQIYLPNNQTNASNVNIQPNEVNDGGKTFHWYAWYDFSHGWTIKFPIQVGTTVNEYYPKMRFEQNFGRGGDQSADTNEAKYSLPEYDIDLKGADKFPLTFNFPVNDVIYMDEISK